MESLIYLIPIAFFVAAIALGAFLWTVKNRQYEDMKGAASRILIEDDDKPL
jgi:cbb3-type cytochrome oxidase maturation protein